MASVRGARITLTGDQKLKPNGHSAVLPYKETTHKQNTIYKFKAIIIQIYKKIYK